MSEMQFRSLGRSGLKVSVVGLGCNNFGARMDAEAVASVVHAAIDGGINLFDTADVYSHGQSEEYLGRAIAGRRDRVIVATKFFGSMGNGPNDGGGSRGYIRRAVEASLSRLGTDYIDLYQMHNPDPETPLDETLSALDDLVHEGKVRYLGCSNYAGWQIADADWTARTNRWTQFISAQNHYSWLERKVETEVIPACTRFGLGILPYFPLASGLLTGKYRRGQKGPDGARLTGHARADRWLNDRSFDIVEALEAFGEEHGVSLLQIAIGGLAAQSQVSSVIAGATTVEQVRANMTAGCWVPTADELADIDRITSAQ